MGRITRLICLLLLLGIVAVHKASPNEVDDSAIPSDNLQKFPSERFQHIRNQGKIPNLIKDRFNERMQKVFDRLKYRVLKDPYSVEEKVWLFYNTCLTAPRFTHLWNHYIEWVPPGRGLTWPHLTHRDSQWPEEKFKWLETAARLRRFGLENLLIEMKVQPSTEDYSQFKVIIGKQKIDTINDEMLTKKLLLALGVSKKKAGILARDITALEGEIKKLGEPQGSQPTNLSIEEFKDRTKIDLGRYLGIAIGSSFDSSFVVMTSDISYLASLQDLLDTFESETVANYLMVSFVWYLIDQPGSSAEGDPKKCATAVASHMYTASELLYKGFYLRQGKFQRYNDVVQRHFQSISKVALNDLQRNPMNLTAESTHRLTQRLNAMTVSVGQLPNVENQRSFVNDFYWDLNLAFYKPDFALIHLKVLEHRNQKILEQLDKPVPKGREFFLLSNDDYASGSVEQLEFNNTVFLPIDILQAPIVEPEVQEDVTRSLLGQILTDHILRNLASYNHDIKRMWSLHR